MGDKYKEWIDNYQGNIFRKCIEVTNEMKEAFPELEIVKGMVTIVEDFNDYPHQWLKNEQGKIVDPTAKQWLGIVEYKEIREADDKPVGKCPNCGKWVYGRFYNGMFCNELCSKAYENYLMQ